jgi:peptidoglycan-associated lipoprotein
MMTKSLALAALLALGACSSGVKLDDASKSGARGGATDARNVAPVDVSRDPLNPNSPLAKRSVYFDFDSYSVKSDYQGCCSTRSTWAATRAARS